MSYYEILLFLHVAAAITWLGSAVFFFLLFQRAKTARDPLLAERLGAHTDWLAKRFFIPVSLSVLVLGILLTIEGPWSFDQLWILLGLGGMATSFSIGVALVEPTTKKMHAALEAHGPAHPEVARYSGRLDGLAVFDLTVLFSVVWDMALKPTTDDVSTLVVPALALAAAGLYLARAFRSGATGPAPTTT